MSTAPSSAAPADSLFSAFGPLLPLMAMVFIGYIPMGMALPVLPRHVHDALGQGTFVVGVVMGAQYLSAILLGRGWSGAVTDLRGPRAAALGGLVGACGVGAVYFASLALPGPSLSLATLVAGRLATGVAEAFIITAALSWGMARVGPAHAGKVIGWIGMALFAAYGLGAPIGAAVHARFGFEGIALATVLVPLLAFVVARRIPTVAPTQAKRPPFYRVLGAVKLPGAALTLASFGYAAINAFVALLFVQRGWGSAALAFTSLGAGFIAARLLVGHLPDRVGGARVAGWCMLAEALGQALIGLAPGVLVACAGAALTGAGYALAFQGFGVEAVRRAPPQSRGAAMGGYVVFQDLSMGLAGPLGGWLALHAGLQAVYLVAAAGALGAAGLAWWMVRR
ncbi:MAG TPA: arabinose transporter [Ramlibacter sp.]|uniref:arabinose transporter n=1 Tax=Ramlibacter sp. TaxID=1917967 RepID=UPI002D49B4FA|nr:arabinose transporter [Ramlibacter sp.]HZY17431.1 arabinose transporter [Ramlibacter sp.]